MKPRCWPLIPVSVRSWRSYGKIGDCEQSKSIERLLGNESISLNYKWQRISLRPVGIGQISVDSRGFFSRAAGWFDRYVFGPRSNIKTWTKPEIAHEKSQTPSVWQSYISNFIYLFIYRFVQCTGERTEHVVPYLVHPPNPLPSNRVSVVAKSLYIIS